MNAILKRFLHLPLKINHQVNFQVFSAKNFKEIFIFETFLLWDTFWGRKTNFGTLKNVPNKRETLKKICLENVF